MNREIELLRTDTHVFWGEIAPCNDPIRSYDNHPAFINSLEQYVADGLLSGESVIIIATGAHLKLLNSKLKKRGLDPDHLAITEKYFPIDVHETLSRFIVNGWPNDILFVEHLGAILTKARKNSRVRAFGEMVALMWEKGNRGATLHLENLWRQFSKAESFCMICAYPKSGFTQDAVTSLHHISQTHSKVTTDFQNPS